MAVITKKLEVGLTEHVASSKGGFCYFCSICEIGESMASWKSVNGAFRTMTHARQRSVQALDAFNGTSSRFGYVACCDQLHSDSVTVRDEPCYRTGFSAVGPC